MVFSDESRIEIQSGRQHSLRRPRSAYFRYNPKYMSSKVCGHQRSPMVFGAIGYSRLRRLVLVDRIKDSQHYREILEQRLLQVLDEDANFQQDNATCYTSREVKEFMKNHGLALLPD